MQAAQAYVAGYSNSDLQLSEIMEFADNFYVVVGERSTTTQAFELLVDRYTGFVHPEPGPNMMWNTKYGMMSGGMMGGGWGMMGARLGSLPFLGQGRQPQTTTPTAMPVTVEQARQYAQTWLTTNMPGATPADDAHAFYGYYAFDFERNGQVAGMLSVNGYNGVVWYHNWHGDFISERELD